jgi:putative transposase
LDASGEQLSRPFFMNTGGFDGRQARLRRQMDQLKSQRDRLKQLSSSAQRTQKIAELEREIRICWAAYERRNEALAHLCSNL